jgi:hypothetical protein
MVMVRVRVRVRVRGEGEGGVALDGRMRWHSMYGPSIRARARAGAGETGAGAGAGAVSSGEEEKEAEPVPAMRDDAGPPMHEDQRVASGGAWRPIVATVLTALAAYWSTCRPHLRRASDSRMYHDSGIRSAHAGGPLRQQRGDALLQPPMSNDAFAQRSFRSPVTSARNTVSSAALSSLGAYGAHGSIMDVHLIVSPNPLGASRALNTQVNSMAASGSSSSTGTTTPQRGRMAGTSTSNSNSNSAGPGSDAFFSQAVSNLTQLLQAQSQILDEQIAESNTAVSAMQSLRSVASEGLRQGLERASEEVEAERERRRRRRRRRRGRGSAGHARSADRSRGGWHRVSRGGGGGGGGSRSWG